MNNYLSNQDFAAHLLEAAPDAIIGIDHQGRIAIFNDQASVIFGYSWDEVLGEQIHKLIPGRYRQVHSTYVEQYFTSPKTRKMGNDSFELVGLKKDGTEIYVDISLSMVPTAAKGIALCSIRDVSAIRKTEKALLLRDAILSALAICANKLLSSPVWDSEIDLVLRQLGEAAGASKSFLVQWMEDPTAAACRRRIHQWCAVPSGAVLPILYSSLIDMQGYGLGGCVDELLANNPVLIIRESFDTSLIHAYGDNAPSGVLLMPLFQSGQLWGVLGFEKDSVIASWSEYEIDALKSAASMLSASLDREATMFRLERDERILLHAQEISGIGGWEYDHRLDLVSWSQGVYRIFEKEKGRFVPSIDSTIPLFHFEDQKIIRDRLGKTIKPGGSFDLAARLQFESGRVKHIQMKGSTQVDEQGEAIISRGTILDITERVHREEALKSSEEKFRTLYERSPIGFYRTNPSGLILECNDALASLLRFSSKSQIIGKYTSDLFANLSVDNFRKALDENGNVLQDFESTLRLKSGRIIHLLENANQFFLPDGSSYLEGTVIDISMRKQTELILSALSVEVASQDLASFLAILVQNLSLAFGVEHSYVSLLYDEGASATAIAMWSDGQLLEPFSYELKDTPCETAIKKDYCFVSSGVQKLYPKDIALRALQAESYVGYPMISSSGQVFGIVGLIGKAAFFRDSHVDQLLKLVAKQVAAIVEQRESEKLIVESRQRLQDIIFSAQLGTWEWNSRTGEVRVNDRWAEIIGYSLAELQPVSFETWVSRLHPDDFDTATELIKQHLRGKTNAYEHEARLRHKDGHWVWVRIVGKIISHCEDQRPEWVFGTTTDITKSKEAEAEIILLNTDLERRVAARTCELERLNNDLEAFSYSISHDLRTPIVVLKYYTDALFNKYGGGMDEEGLKILLAIRQSGLDMDQLIKALLAFFGLKRRNVEMESVDLDSLIHSLVEPHIRKAVPRPVFDLTPLPQVNGDKDMLKQVFTNLISNAVKYSSKVESPVVKIGFWEEVEETVFYVKDNGNGFDMSFVDRLFQNFQRLHDSSEYEGVGLGLAIVKKIIDKHGGKVWAEGEPGHGATFYFTLPR